MIRKFVFTLCFFAIIACQQKENQKELTPFYIGTYTNSKSKGIYKYAVDSKGKLSKIGLVASTNNPSFLAISTNKKYILAVDETDANGTGFVKSFKIHSDSLEHLNTSMSGGAHPCFLHINKDNQVLVANYSGGNVGYLQLENNGKLSSLIDVQQHFGKGKTSRQQSPHAHSTKFHPKQNEVISADLGTNELWFSKIDSTSNTFKLTTQQKLKIQNGVGPRHFVFHPNNQWIYVLNELSNTVSLIKKINKTYQEVSSKSTLPKDYKEYSVAAEIKITNDGRFIYVSNRGHQSITGYKVDENSGELTFVFNANSKGKTPRNFALTVDEKYLIAANQDSNNLVSFARNKNTGELTFVDKIEAPTPTYVLF